MYMGVIPIEPDTWAKMLGAPHVYGGDPIIDRLAIDLRMCSPCIWG